MFVTLRTAPCSRARAQAHDEVNACSPGDIVRLEESRPLSKRKRCACLSAARYVAPRAPRAHAPHRSTQLGSCGGVETRAHLRAGTSRQRRRIGSAIASSRCRCRCRRDMILLFSRAPWAFRDTLEKNKMKPKRARFVPRHMPPNARSPASPKPGTMRPFSSSCSSIMLT